MNENRRTVLKGMTAMAAASVTGIAEARSPTGEVTAALSDVGGWKPITA